MKDTKRRHRTILPLLSLLVISLLAGCAGDIRPTTWTGLVVSDGTIYAADLEQVRALKGETGEVLWSFPQEPDLRQYGPFYTVTLEDGEALFVTSYERSGGGLFSQSRGVLRALDIERREVIWTFTEAGGEFVACGAVEEGILVIGNSDGNVYALHTEDGTAAWAQPFTTGGRVWATPLVVSNTVYISSLDHNLYALDLNTGEERWRFTAGGALTAQPLLLNSLLYIGSFDHRLYAIRQEDGSIAWQYEGENWFWGSLTSDSTRLYAADVNGNVYALDPATGQEIWRSKVDQSVHLTPVLDADGKMLVVAGDGGTLYGLDTDDGFVLWTQPGEGRIASAVADNGIVYISRIYAAQHIQAFHIENGRLLWVYPEQEAEE